MPIVGGEDHPFAQKRRGAENDENEILFLVMVIGFGIIVLQISGAHSLKEKRRIIKSIVGRSKNEFNASIAEVGANDVHQRAHIGYAFVGNDQRLVNSKIDKLFSFIDDLHLAEIIDTTMEMIHI